MNRPTDLSDLRIDLDKALDRLTPRQRQAVELYRDGFTQEEIGKIMGVSHQVISKIFKNLVAKTQYFHTT